jgi:hypothetical protein
VGQHEQTQFGHSQPSASIANYLSPLTNGTGACDGSCATGMALSNSLLATLG